MDPIEIDVSVLLFGLLLTMASAMLMSAAPLTRALRADPQVILKETAARVGGSRGATRLRDGLVALQVAMALTLLVTVGLSADAFRKLVSHDPGLDANGVLTATIELPAQGSSAAARSKD